MIKLFFYYAASVIVLLFYGAEVCQFIHSLTVVKWLGTLLAYYAVAFVLRLIFNNYALKHSDPIGRPFRQFLFDFSLFILVGFSIAVNNLIFFHFPLGSGMKAFIGVIGLGFFFALEMALKTERDVILSSTSISYQHLKDRRLFSVSKKIGLILASGLILIITILSLLIVKDFQSITAETLINGDNLNTLLPDILKDIFFALATLFLLFLNLILSYAGNLKLYFDKFFSVLRSIEKGNYDQQVSIPSRDEFALLASHTNLMIDGLKDKERIKSIFGKLVNSRVADMILNKTDDHMLSGKRISVVVLFSDIRNFTSMSESNSPEVIISDLNIYFSHMVDIIHRNNGIIDKFIGDGIFAVFGFDDSCKAADDAVKAANEMASGMDDINSKLNQPFRIGIGIHCGEVIAGKIGSKDRMEYTFIGDTVNTASRLEGLNKELSTTIIISHNIYTNLSDEFKLKDWSNLGEKALKGKEKPVFIYGR